MISIHAPRVGSDAFSICTLPPATRHFNPRSPCGERPVGASIEIAKLCISIHAPRVGSDPTWSARLPNLKNFNPRSPCGERRLTPRPSQQPRRFQSTLPVWVATSLHRSWTVPHRNFNPRSPCGERHPLQPRQSILGHISIHAPRVGSDMICCSTLIPVDSISIHAPRVGSDAMVCRASPETFHFNPRSPCGERLGVGRGRWEWIYFNPRSPCGERRPSIRPWPPRPGISIHAPRVGSDGVMSVKEGQASDFNPRSPCGERHSDSLLSGSPSMISIHAPRVGSDKIPQLFPPLPVYFNPRSPCGERQLYYDG